ncbi:MAG: succinylglutamate desuccinylase/aspartoacylase family protein [Photobacterium halotolerans]
MAKARLNKVIEFIGTQVPPGQSATIDLEAAQLYTHSPLHIPVHVVNGRYQGPVMLVSAAIHGDELNGVEAVRQLLNKVDPLKLHGTLVAVPVVNVFGFIHKSRYLPDRRDLNRCFPGSERGSTAARMAYQFSEHVVKKCTHIIDLHTGAIHRGNLPQVRANLEDQESAEMAHAFGTPVILDSAIRDGSLRAVADAAGIPVITYEGGEALRFEPLVIAAAVKGIVSVMRMLGMIRRVSRKKEQASPFIARSSSWVRAEQNGIVRCVVALGERVTKGQVLAYISAPLGHGEDTMVAPRDGIVIGQQMLPLVNEGDAVFHLAYFSKGASSEVEQQIESFLDEVSDEVDIT